MLYDFNMNYTYKKSNTLTEDAKNIRVKVFVEEQGFLNEFDELDSHAAHIVVYDGEAAVGVCRYYKGINEGEYIAGRIAVIKEYRGMDLGRYIMRVIEENVSRDGGRYIAVSAQTRAAGFYERSGYKPEGDIYYDEYCPHIKMRKKIN